MVTQLLVIEAVFWIILVMLVWWSIFNASAAAPQTPLYFSSTVSIAAGVVAFIRHGHNTITATGLFGLSTALFIGYSGFVFAGPTESDAQWQFLVLASGVGLTAQVATTILAWTRVRVERPQRRWFSPEVANRAVWAGLAILVVSAGIHLAMPTLASWTTASAFTAICILAGGLLLRDSARMISWGTLVIGMTLLLYSEFFHAGTGRLLLVALACAVAIIYAIRFQKRSFKIALVILIPIALWWMANDRLALEAEIAGQVSADRTGLESMIATLNVFALLLESLQEGNFTPSYGYTFLSVPALVIPESVWPNQPRALGYEVVQLYAPERYGDGIFSTVVSSTGEGIFNFGWLGLPIVILAVAGALRLLDRLIFHQVTVKYETLLGLLTLVLVAMLAGAIADYTWSGVHTYSARMLGRMPAFLLVLFIAWVSSRKRVPDPKNLAISSGTTPERRKVLL